MRKLSGVVFAFLLFGLTLSANKHEYEYIYEYDYNDTLDYDATVGLDGIVAEPELADEYNSFGTVVVDDVIIDVTSEDTKSISPIGESSSRQYAGKQFKVGKPDGSEFEFVVNMDGVSVTLKSGDANGVSNLVIPSSVEGLGSNFFVTNIAESAYMTFFKSPMKGVKHLEISEGVQSVGEYCFKGALDLESASLPTSLKSISFQMFANCRNLNHITIPSVSELSAIGDFAFQNCDSLSIFTIPGSVTTIGIAPWSGCTSLEKIVLDDENHNFVERGGVLYSGWQGNLIQYPAGKKDKEYQPLSGTININGQAFYGNPYIEKIIFPASLDSISYAAFANCVSLREVVFNSSDIFIDRAAFNFCPSLKEVVLYGSPEYSVKDGQSKTFDDETRIVIEKEISTFNRH